MTPESMAVYEEWQRPHCLGAKPGNYSWIIAEVSGAGTLTLHSCQPLDGLSACNCAAIQASRKRGRLAARSVTSCAARLGPKAQAAGASRGPCVPCTASTTASDAGQTPAVLTLANWTLQQPLAAKPGQQYSYTNDAFWLLTYIIEKASQHCT